jgi:hypothetical protein
VVIGLVLTPVCIGIFFLIAAFFQRERKYQCGHCCKWF